MSSSTGGVGASPQFVLSQAEVAPVDVDTAAVGTAIGAHPSVSGDGRYVVFQGAPLSPDDARTSTIFFTDRESGATTELSPVPEGLRAGDTVQPVISGNGCTVVAVTQMALDVFRDDDTGDRWDVYRSTLPHCDGTVGDWELVSSRTGSGGIARDDVVVARPTTSRSGTLIAYTHPADHLFDAEGITTISLVDATVPIDDPLRLAVRCRLARRLAHRHVHPCRTGPTRAVGQRCNTLRTDPMLHRPRPCRAGRRAWSMADPPLRRSIRGPSPNSIRSRP